LSDAIFGLVGVVIGGLLTGALQVFQQRRSDRAEARAAARLLSAELSEQLQYLDALVKQDPAVRGNEHAPTISAWPKYRAAMARLLDDRTWQAVAGAYVELSRMNSSQALDPPALDELVQDAHKRLQDVWWRDD